MFDQLRAARDAFDEEVARVGNLYLRVLHENVPLAAMVSYTDCGVEEMFASPKDCDEETVKVATYNYQAALELLRECVSKYN